MTYSDNNDNSRLYFNEEMGFFEGGVREITMQIREPTTADLDSVFARYSKREVLLMRVCIGLTVALLGTLLCLALVLFGR